MVRRLDDSSAMETSLVWDGRLQAGLRCGWRFQRLYIRNSERRGLQAQFEAREILHRGFEQTLDASEQLFRRRELESQLAWGRHGEARGQGSAPLARRRRRWQYDAPGARPALDRFERLDEPGLARGLGGGHAAVRAHLLQSGKQLVPGDHLGGADLIAVMDPDQVVGLAPAHSEELLDGWAVDHRHIHVGEALADIVEFGVPAGSGGHGNTIPSSILVIARTGKIEVGYKGR